MSTLNSHQLIRDCNLFLKSQSNKFNKGIILFFMILGNVRIKNSKITKTYSRYKLYSVQVVNYECPFKMESFEKNATP